MHKKLVEIITLTIDAVLKFEATLYVCIPFKPFYLTWAVRVSDNICNRNTCRYFYKMFLTLIL